MKRVGLITIIIYVLGFQGKCQNSLDDLNIFFAHDFNSNTAGRYDPDQWTKDFLNPPWVNRLDELKIVEDPTDEVNPTKAMFIDFPANSLGPAEGGTHWQSPLPQGYEEMYVSYDIMFMRGFQFQRGGKIPGVKGGSVSGETNKPNGYDGFIAYLMFKADRPVFYIYYPDANIPQYGVTWEWGQTYSTEEFSPSQIKFEYASGAVHFETGVWHNLTFRVVLNTVNPSGGGNFDGILEAWFDGKLVMEISHILFRHTKDLKIDKLVMHGFFGGGDDSWRNPIYEWIKYDNVMLYTFKEGMDVPRGNNLSPTNRSINYWRKMTGVPTISEEVPQETDDNQSEDTTPEEVTTEEPAPVVAVTPVTPVALQPAVTLPANHAPVIASQTMSVLPSNVYNFSSRVDASDPDQGQVLRYDLISGNEKEAFVLNSGTGLLTLNLKKLNFDNPSTYTLKVQVTDNGSPSLSSVSEVFVKVIPATAKYHIDPENSNDPLEDGSKLHPFDSWGDITWKDGIAVYQKSNTRTQIDEISIGASNVLIDTYGGDLPAVIESETKNYVIRAFEKSNITIRHLSIMAGQALSCIYALGAESNNINVERCILQGSANGVRFVDVKNVTLSYNTFQDNEEAILSYADTTYVTYNVFVRNTTAVNISGSESESFIFNNVFFENHQGIENSYADMTLYNNIFYMADPTDIALNNQLSNLVSDNNLYYPEQPGFIKANNKSFDNLVSYQKQENLDLNSIIGNPMFVDPGRNDFSLLAESPAINTGKLVSKTTDFAGSSVPSGKGTDIGAFENKDAYIKNSNNLLVYPNPSSGNVILKLIPSLTNESENTVSEFDLNIHDMSGRIVLHKSVPYDDLLYMHNLDLSRLPRGSYRVVLDDGSEITTGSITLN
jgi:hypothetical protein